MDQVIVDLLQQMGLGVAANAAYDFLKPFVGRPVDPSTLQTGLQNIIRLQGVKMDAATVINALAQKGYLSVQGSRLHGEQGLVFGSIQGGALAGNKTRLSTSSTVRSKAISRKTPQHIQQ